MGAGLAGFDIAALIVIFISGVMALTRGFVREALTVTAFVAAALGALWLRPVFADLAFNLVESAVVANAAALITIFLLIYLAVSFVTSSLVKHVKSGEDVSVIDRTAGFAFGVVRGLVLLGLVVLVFQNAAPNAQPDWLRGARVYPLASATAALLQSLAPDGSWAAREDAAREDEEDLDREGLERLISGSDNDEDG